MMVTVKACDPVPAGWALSVAVTVSGKLPAAVGVPDNDPSLPNVRPGGGVPMVIAQVKGARPPLATANE